MSFIVTEFPGHLVVESRTMASVHTNNEDDIQFTIEKGDQILQTSE